MTRLMMIAAAAAFAFTLPASPAAAQGSLSPFPAAKAVARLVGTSKAQGKTPGCVVQAGS